MCLCLPYLVFLFSPAPTMLDPPAVGEREGGTPPTFFPLLLKPRLGCCHFMYPCATKHMQPHVLMAQGSEEELIDVRTHCPTN